MDKTLDAIHKLLDCNRQTVAQMLSHDGFGRMQMSKTDSAPHLMELYGLLSDLHMKTCSAKVWHGNGAVFNFILKRG
jgi:hypothetical protein